MKQLKMILGKGCQAMIEDRGEVCLIIKKEYLIDSLKLLRDHSSSQFKVLVDITAVDYPAREKRFEVVYQLLSVRYSERLRLKVLVDAFEGVPTVTEVYAAGNWFEREVWDLFGVYFENHPDLRRLMTDYGFEGHPMRKDFPLTGYVEVRYDEKKKGVVTEPLEMAQEFR
jgi:NADH/F420H2 dehydrogenase subunit C